MSIKTAFAILALASALTLTPTLGATQSAGNAPVAFSADDGEATATGVALRGRAEIVQGDNRLRADAIELTRINGEVTRATASGNVYFVTPDQNARGDQAVFNVASDEVVVTGDVILTQGRNVLTGNRVVYNTRTQDARISGGGAGGRIQGVFYPEGSGN